MKSLLFIYLLTYGGALVALFNPFVGLLIYVCFALLKPEVLWQWSVPEGNYSRVIGIAMLVGWALKGFGTWQFGRARAIVTAFIAYWLCMTASSANAAVPEVAWKAVDVMTKIIVPFVLGMTIIDSVGRLKALIWVMVGSLGYVAYEENLHYFQQGGWNFDQTINMLAHQMAAGSFLALFAALHARRLPVKVVSLLIAGLMAHVVAIHMSRGAMVGLCIGTAVSLAILKKSPGKFAIVLAGASAAGILAGSKTQAQFLTIFRIEDRLHSTHDSGQWEADLAHGVKPESAEERLRLWQTMPRAAMRNPAFGSGPEHWPLIAPEYGFPKGKQGHNLWLQTAVELGLLGLGCYFCFFGITVVRLWKCLRSQADGLDPWVLAAIQMAFVSTFVLMVEGMFGSFHREVESYYYTVLVGAVGLRLAAAQPACAAEQEPLVADGTWLAPV